MLASASATAVDTRVAIHSTESTRGSTQWIHDPFHEAGRRGVIPAQPAVRLESREFAHPAVRIRPRKLL
ncbi:hypothetical protein HZ326_29451 [Fusarium oxysporum f. sp. albedinis]|nr:hypothetical protein HZ326_29451 [Fusarium oxysporum f. sp. albedinis]